MNKKISTIAGSLIILAVVIALGFSFLASNKKEEMQNQNNVVLDNPRLGNKKEVKQGEEKKLGEERDEHNCLISNGSFWCEEKQNCVQDWSRICSNIDILNISEWENFDSQDSSLKLKFSFKYPKTWFNQGDISGGYGSDIPFFSKDKYSRECNGEFNGNRTTCKQSGKIMLVEILSPDTLPREVKHNNKQQKTIKINNYNGYIFEGIVNDTLGGYVAENGQTEAGIVFSDINKARFEIIMKIENNSDKEIFNKIVSTLKLN
ncbi:MAG: hypothetical protein UR66_C0003G0017 [Candidatus Moranbacteria bacterium GW2011_GWE1_35_17]|nr:MAG: hypothetical protein UR65_C0059G0001 [Candidatus Moranbacteria bacterium GW2011_GWE2_35_164]KKP68752.1 MAG: hypothetical protein UR66_C0003G0017 [Candidatus Moranbacteria bacterium GW2011_GWE1_35_17]KKP82943.1 MAG: hypothetical protein UR82_C0027G0017 [Candidatus Moranbacteria bacterium GW2011_GWF1_35_5]KKP83059.1 MAG: hypothetical protein UR83_C0040G0007 [Candidatus Moranbacteria bacterium GW2011_GWF2_35_54]